MVELDSSVVEIDSTMELCLSVSDEPVTIHFSNHYFDDTSTNVNDRTIHMDNEK